MFKKKYLNNNHETILYNNIVSLSRNKILYTKFMLSDTFQNRIHLIFIHISFLFIKIKASNGMGENWCQHVLIFNKSRLYKNLFF